MSFKIIASVLALSAATVVPALAQEGTTPTPPPAPALGLPGAVTGVALPATNLLIVGGALVASVAIVAGDEGGDSDEATTTTTTN